MAPCTACCARHEDNTASWAFAGTERIMKVGSMYFTVSGFIVSWKRAVI
eukprot:CAMPEP_0194547940 /NCGR_PEP_ID=MMETSP0253-20130528/92890_1 /TAXON_ID=2966 /ORGANISM="Noctiluca scintillans" /LENGTH=48 /DNA_ID= /DNA_START= /DNA_END= /DNA_ORIENTATION=